MAVEDIAIGLVTQISAREVGIAVGLQTLDAVFLGVGVQVAQQQVTLAIGGPCGVGGKPVGKFLRSIFTNTGPEPLPVALIVIRIGQ